MSQENVNQNLASAEESQAEAVSGALKELHTALPGIIASFNEVLQTASVQPAISRIGRDDKSTPLPLCVDVPVHFPGGGNFVLTFPVAAGDECLLIFSERAIDAWFEAGEVSPPADFRLHDLSDGFALVGTRSKANSITGLSTTGIELRTLDNTTKALIEADNIELITPTASVKLGAGECEIKAPNGITLDGPITLKGPITTVAGNGGTGDATFAGPITAQAVTAGTVSLTGHTHSNPEGGNVGAAT